MQTCATVFEFNLDKPARVYVENDERSMNSITHDHTTFYSVLSPGGGPGDAYDWEDNSTSARSDQHWNDAGAAGGSSSNGVLFVQSSGPGSTYACTEQKSWPDDLWPWLQDGTGTLAGDCGSGSRAIDPAFWGLNWEHCEVSDPVGPTITLHYLTHVNNPPDWQQDEHDETYVRHAQTRLKLATGGRAVPGRQSLIRITGWATEVPHQRAVPPFGDYYDRASWPAIPPEQIQVGTLGNLDANGELWVVLPDGDPDVTIYAPGWYFFYIFRCSGDAIQAGASHSVYSRNKSEFG